MHHHRPKGTRKGSESGFNGQGHRWWWTNGSVQCCWVGGCASGEFGKCINFEWLQLSSGGGGLGDPVDMQSSPRKRGSFDKLQFGHQLGLYYFIYCSLCSCVSELGTYTKWIPRPAQLHGILIQRITSGTGDKGHHFYFLFEFI